MTCKKIILKEKLNKALEMTFVAEDLFKYINNLKEEEICLDFKDIEFMSLSFTQEYIYQKNKSLKKIKEENLSKDVEPMLKLVETRKKR